MRAGGEEERGLAGEGIGGAVVSSATVQAVAAVVVGGRAWPVPVCAEVCAAAAGKPELPGAAWAALASRRGALGDGTRTSCRLPRQPGVALPGEVRGLGAGAPAARGAAEGGSAEGRGAPSGAARPRSRPSWSFPAPVPCAAGGGVLGRGYRVRWDSVVLGNKTKYS